MAGDIDGQVRSLASLLLLTVVKAPLGHVLAGHSLLPESCVPAAPHLGTEIKPLRRHQPMVNAVQTYFLREWTGREPIGEAVDAAPRGGWTRRRAVGRKPVGR